ncbi:hypothetical protein R75461_04620 [Paraburkholderia nemoris]|nr:hypothetical protein R75461_04620 [Paraburkholderia nemoris]
MRPDQIVRAIRPLEQRHAHQRRDLEAETLLQIGGPPLRQSQRMRIEILRTQGDTLERQPQCASDDLQRRALVLPEKLRAQNVMTRDGLLPRVLQRGDVERAAQRQMQLVRIALLRLVDEAVIQDALLQRRGRIKIDHVFGQMRSHCIELRARERRKVEIVTGRHRLHRLAMLDQAQHARLEIAREVRNSLIVDHVRAVTPCERQPFIRNQAVDVDHIRQRRAGRKRRAPCFGRKAELPALLKRRIEAAQVVEAHLCARQVNKRPRAMRRACGVGLREPHPVNAVETHIAHAVLHMQQRIGRVVRCIDPQRIARREPSDRSAQIEFADRMGAAMTLDVDQHAGPRTPGAQRLRQRRQQKFVHPQAINARGVVRQPARDAGVEAHFTGAARTKRGGGASIAGHGQPCVCVRKRRAPVRRIRYDRIRCGVLALRRNPCAPRSRCSGDGVVCLNFIGNGCRVVAFQFAQQDAPRHTIDAQVMHDDQYTFAIVHFRVQQAAHRTVLDVETALCCVARVVETGDRVRQRAQIEALDWCATVEWQHTLLPFDRLLAAVCVG